MDCIWLSLADKVPLRWKNLVRWSPQGWPVCSQHNCPSPWWTFPHLPLVHREVPWFACWGHEHTEWSHHRAQLESPLRVELRWRNMERLLISQAFITKLVRLHFDKTNFAILEQGWRANIIGLLLSLIPFLPPGKELLIRKRCMHCRCSCRDGLRLLVLAQQLERQLGRA